MEMVSTHQKLADLEVVVSLHTSHDPPADEWARYIALLIDVKRKVGVSAIRNLVVSDGGAPNTAQRSELTVVFDGRPNKIAVLTNSLDNPIKRGVATAISWINPSFRATLPNRWADAFRHLDLTGHEGAVLAVLDGLQKDLPKVASLRELHKLIGR